MVEWDYRQALVEPTKQNWQVDDLVMVPKELSEIGTEGWDLVTAFPLIVEGTTLAAVYIFKRPKPA